MLYRLLALFTCTSLCWSCGPTVVYESVTSLPEVGWSYTDTVRFDFTIPSAEQAYDLVLQLDHRSDFPSQNFYVRLHTGFPSGKRTSEQLSLQLAGDFGAWNGDCSGERCEQRITILRNAKFKDTGAYYLTVEQYTREPVLTGIERLGLAVVERE